MAPRRQRWVIALAIMFIGPVLMALSTKGFWMLSSGPFESTYLFRLGFIATLAGTVWYVAECASLSTMRLVAAAAGVGVAVALIYIGDQRRIDNEATAYLPLRESVRTELVTLADLGVAEPSDIENADDVADPTIDGSPSPVAASGRLPQQAVFEINRAGHVADAKVATCPAVTIRAVSAGLPPLLEPATTPTLRPEPVANNLIEVANRTRDGETELVLGDEARLRLDVFLALLDATDLTDEMTTGPDHFLILLPPAKDIQAELAKHTDKLYAELRSGELADNRALVEVMQLHAVRAENLLEEPLSALASRPLVTLGGDRLTVKPNDAAAGLSIETSSDSTINVSEEPIIPSTANGVIYAADGLINPPDDILRLISVESEWKPPGLPGVEVRSAHHDFTHFSRALNETGMAETVGGPGQLLVFGPTDAAFKRYWESTGTTEEAFFDSPLLDDLIARHIIPGVGVGNDELVDTQTFESLRLATVEVTVTPASGEDHVDITLDDIATTATGKQASNGTIYAVDEILASAERTACQPRDASLALLGLLKDELVAATGRTDSGAQEQIAARLDNVQQQIDALSQTVAVQELVVDGADTLIAGFLDPLLRDDVAARVGGWGWLIITATLIIVYRLLEIANGSRNPGPVVVKSDAAENDDKASKEDSARAATIVKHILGQAELREPSQIPGAETTRQVAELLQDDAFPGSKAATITLGLIRSTAFPRKGVIVTAATEPATRDGWSRVTVRATDARTHFLLFSQPFENRTLREAATDAAHFVAAQALARGVTVAPWARWPNDDGTGLGAYQQVALDDRRRPEVVDADLRLKHLEQAAAACPHSGLARVALAQEYLLAGPVNNDPLGRRYEIGAALMAGLPHLTSVTQLYPEFLLGRYRLAASLSMLSEDIDSLWHYSRSLDLTDGAIKGGQMNAERPTKDVAAEVSSILFIESRHRREWRPSAAALGRDRLHKLGNAIRMKQGTVRRLLRARLPIRTVVASRVNDDEREQLRIDSRSAPTHADSRADPKTGPTAGSDVDSSTEQAGRSASPAPSRELLLRLAAREVRSALADIRFAHLRLWHQDEREYWLQLIFNRKLRGRHKASFRVLGEIIDLRVLDEVEPGEPRTDLRIGRVDEIQNRHRNDAVTTYATACFYGVLLSRTIGESSDHRLARTKYADRAIHLVREARSAENGYLINHQWVERDPDLWSIAETDPDGWRMLIDHLTRLRSSVNSSSPRYRRRSSSTRAGRAPASPSGGDRIMSGRGR